MAQRACWAGAITLCGAMLLALTFARLAAALAADRRAVRVRARRLRRPAGFVVAWSYWISTWCGNAAIAVAFAGSLGALFPAFTATPVRAAGCALGALWLCTRGQPRRRARGRSHAGDHDGAEAAAAAAVRRRRAVVRRRQPLPCRSIPAANRCPMPCRPPCALTLWAFLGLEAATVPAGAIRDPSGRSRARPSSARCSPASPPSSPAPRCSACCRLDIVKSSQAPMADAARRLWGRPPASASRWSPRCRVSARSTAGCWSPRRSRSRRRATACCRDVSRELDAQRHARVRHASSAACWPSLLVLSNYTHTLVQLFTFSILLSTAATLLPYVVSTAAWLRRGNGGGAHRRRTAHCSTACMRWSAPAAKRCCGARRWSRPGCRCTCGSAARRTERASRTGGRYIRSVGSSAGRSSGASGT